MHRTSIAGTFSPLHPSSSRRAGGFVLFGLAMLGLALCGLSPHAALADGYPPEEALKRMKTAEGFTVDLVAAEPLVKQPVSMTFDHRGRLWVVQYLQYPNPAGLKAVAVDRYLRTIWDKVPEPPPHGPKGVDRITILEDTTGDGRADKSTDFLSDLNLTTGMALGHGGVFVLQSPYLLFYADRNQDDRPDGPPEVLLSGFGMEDSHAFANSLTWGPDGWLYGAQGSTVTAHIRGQTFQQGIWRYHPKTKAFELFAEGGGNTWGVDFDQHGQLLAGTNYGHRAMLHQVQGGYYVKNFGKHGELQNPYAFGFFEHVPYADFQGGHVTCGGVAYQGGAFPPAFNNQYIAANLLSNVIDWHLIAPQGSSFANRRGGPLMSTDDAWFRPIDCTVGPDGALYVADWYDRRANHVDPKDDWDKTNGRIYRIRWNDASKTTSPLLKTDAPLDQVLADLDHSNAWRRRAARQLLAERADPKAVELLKPQVLDSKDERLALESLWALVVSGGWNDELAQQLFDHPAEHIRSWAVRLSGDPSQVSPRTAARLLELARRDSSPVVRSQLASTAKRLPADHCLALVDALSARDEDSADLHIPLLLWWAVEDKAAADRSQILSLFRNRPFWNRPIVRQTLTERLARRWSASAGADDFAACAELLALAQDPDDVRLLVRGMELGLKGRRLPELPEPLRAPLDRLWAAQQPPSLDLLRLALRLGSEPAEDLLLARAASKDTPQAERLSLLELAGQIGGPRCWPTVLELVDPQQPSAVQSSALAALARFTAPEIAPEILKRYASLPAPLKPRAVSLLAGRQTWSEALLQAVDQSQFDPKAVDMEQLRQISLYKDKTLDALTAKHWGRIGAQTPGETAARIHGLRVSLRMKPGDPLKGKELFAKNCGNCHTLFGEGGKIGPELTGAPRKDLDFMLTSIVAPSAVIRKEFFSYTVVTVDGRLLTGLIVESTPTSVTILDAKNQRTVLSTSDVDEMEPSPLSLMPEKILDPLDVDQVRDLFSYLQTDPKP